jgi:hypothetical protein
MHVGCVHWKYRERLFAAAEDQTVVAVLLLLIIVTFVVGRLLHEAN